MEKDSNFSIFSLIYIIIFILITFSGTTFLKKYVPIMFIIEIIILFLMAKTTQGKLAAFTNKKIKTLIPFFLVIFFCLFLCTQLNYAFSPRIVKTYLIRYMIMSLFLLYIPNINIFYNSIQYTKKYSILVAVSIIIFTSILGYKSGGLVGDFQAGGMIMSIACIIYIIDYFLMNNNKTNIVSLFLCIISLLISGKRMFSIIVVVSFFAIFLLTNNKKKTRKMILFILLASVGIIMVLNFYPKAREVFNRFDKSSSLVEVTSGRNVLWDKALIAYNQNKIHGIGFGSFQLYFASKYNIQGIDAFLTHNIYIGLLAETGIIGFLIYTFLIFFSLRMIIKLGRRVKKCGNIKLYYVYLYSLMIQLWVILYGFTGNIIYNADQTFIYFISIAMMISIERELSNRRNTNEINQ